MEDYYMLMKMEDFEPPKRQIMTLKKEAYCLLILNGTPKRIRIAVYTVKGCCPRPLDDGGLNFCYKSYSNLNKIKCQLFCLKFLISIVF